MPYNPPRPDAGSDAAPVIRQHTREIATAVGLAMQGKINAVTTLTLTANAASTALSDPRLTIDSAVTLDPLTANAAGALATTYAAAADRNNAAWTFTHANTAATDKTFRVTIIG